MNEEGDIGVPVPNYVEENASTKVVKIIQSYTSVKVKGEAYKNSESFKTVYYDAF